MKKYESYLESPFRLDGLVSKQYITKSDEKVWIDPETAEMYAIKKIPQNKEQITDSKSYTKLFVDNLDLLMKLSGTGLRVLVYAMSTIRPLSQTAILNMADIQYVAKINSPNTIRAAISELIEANIIAQKLGSNIEYWINPNVFFNGNRLRLL